MPAERSSDPASTPKLFLTFPSSLSAACPADCSPTILPLGQETCGPKKGVRPLVRKASSGTYIVCKGSDR